MKKRQVLISLLAVGGLALLTQATDIADGILPEPGELKSDAPARIVASTQAEYRHRIADSDVETAPASAAVPTISAGYDVFAASTTVGPTPQTSKSDRSSTSPRDKMSGPVAALAEAGGPDLVDIVVRYDRHPELFDDERIEALGGEVLRSYSALEMRAIRIPATSLEGLALEQRVDWLSLDSAVSATSVASREAANVPAVRTVNSGYTGGSVNVAIIDSGVGTHPDLAASIEQYSFLGGQVPQPFLVDNYTALALTSFWGGDGFGHGTHVAGIISGSGGDSNGDFQGTAKGAKIYSLQVLNSNGGGQLSDVIAALDWLLLYGNQLKIRVVNVSLGMSVSESITTDPLVLAVERVWDAGIAVVVAAGNGGAAGNFTITSPANSRKVITVGSLTDNGTGTVFSDDYVSTYSSLGPTTGDFVLKPDLVAPGNRLISATPSHSYLKTEFPSRVVACTARKCSSDYLEMSGTSMAAPMVAAAAARMLDKNPDLNPATIKARLMRSARKLDAEPTVAGAGTLDIDAALNETGHVAVAALSPLMLRDDVSGSILVEDTAALWGDAHWSAGFLFHGGFEWTEGYAGDVDGDVDASGYLWTDGSVWAKGYLWTDSGIWAKGYLWTDSRVGGRSLFMNTELGLVMNDDAPNGAPAPVTGNKRRR